MTISTDVTKSSPVVRILSSLNRGMNGKSTVTLESGREKMIIYTSLNLYHENYNRCVLIITFIIPPVVTDRTSVGGPSTPETVAYT